MQSAEQLPEFTKAELSQLRTMASRDRFLRDSLKRYLETGDSTDKIALSMVFGR